MMAIIVAPLQARATWNESIGKKVPVPEGRAFSWMTKPWHWLLRRSGRQVSQVLELEHRIEQDGIDIATLDRVVGTLPIIGALGCATLLRRAYEARRFGGDWRGALVRWHCHDCCCLRREPLGSGATVCNRQTQAIASPMVCKVLAIRNRMPMSTDQAGEGRLRDGRFQYGR